MANNPNITLRPIQMSDAEVLMELNNDREVARNLVGNSTVVTMEQQLQWMANLKNEKDTIRWMIDYEDKAAGTIFLRSIDYFNGTGVVNIKILPTYQGKGIGKAAMKEVFNIAFNEMNLFCLSSSVLSYNISSQMLFKKSGFHEDGVLRSRVIKNGERCDLIAFSLLKTDVLGEDV